MRTSNQTLVYALYQLSKEIYSEDGVANACIAEAADRIVELVGQIRVLEMKLEDERTKH